MVIQGESWDPDPGLSDSRSWVLSPEHWPSDPSPTSLLPWDPPITGEDRLRGEGPLLHGDPDHTPPSTQASCSHSQAPSSPPHPVSTPVTSTSFIPPANFSWERSRTSKSIETERLVVASDWEKGTGAGPLNRYRVSS